MSVLLTLDSMIELLKEHAFLEGELSPGIKVLKATAAAD